MISDYRYFIEKYPNLSWVICRKRKIFFRYVTEYLFADGKFRIETQSNRKLNLREFALEFQATDVVEKIMLNKKHKKEFWSNKNKAYKEIKL